MRNWERVLYFTCKAIAEGIPCSVALGRYSEVHIVANYYRVSSKRILPENMEIADGEKIK